MSQTLLAALAPNVSLFNKCDKVDEYFRGLDAVLTDPSFEASKIPSRGGSNVFEDTRPIPAVMSKPRPRVRFADLDAPPQDPVLVKRAYVDLEDAETLVPRFILHLFDIPKCEKSWFHQAIGVTASGYPGKRLLETLGPASYFITYLRLKKSLIPFPFGMLPDQVRAEINNPARCSSDFFSAKAQHGYVDGNEGLVRLTLLEYFWCCLFYFGRTAQQVPPAGMVAGIDVHSGYRTQAPQNQTTVGYLLNLFTNSAPPAQTTSFSTAHAPRQPVPTVDNIFALLVKTYIDSFLLEPVFPQHATFFDLLRSYWLLNYTVISQDSSFSKLAFTMPPSALIESITMLVYTLHSDLVRQASIQSISFLPSGDLSLPFSSRTAFITHKMTLGHILHFIRSCLLNWQFFTGRNFPRFLQVLKLWECVIRPWAVDPNAPSFDGIMRRLSAQASQYPSSGSIQQESSTVPPLLTNEYTEEWELLVTSYYHFYFPMFVILLQIASKSTLQDSFAILKEVVRIFSDRSLVYRLRQDIKAIEDGDVSTFFIIKQASGQGRQSCLQLPDLVNAKEAAKRLIGTMQRTYGAYAANIVDGLQEIFEITVDVPHTSLFDSLPPSSTLTSTSTPKSTSVWQKASQLAPVLYPYLNSRFTGILLMVVIFFILAFWMSRY